jgi:hypothetical protein
LFFKRKGTTIVSLVILTASIVFLAYRAAEVVTAFDEWVRLKEAKPYSAQAVEKALKTLNEEETTLITPLLFAMLSSAVAFRSVKLKIIPKRCFYCGKWAKAKNVRQTPDKVFHYHEECKVRGRQCKSR